MENPVIRMLKKSTADYVSDSAAVVRSDERSRTGLIVPELIFRYGSLKTHARKFPAIMPWLVPAVIGRLKGYRSLKGNPAAPSVAAGSGLIRELKDYAGSLGCSGVGFAEVSRDLIFKGKSILYTHAIVLAMPMDKEKMALAPDIRTGREVWRIYDRLGKASNRVAKFLRKKGYSAQAGAALGGDVNYPVLAQQAGMGWIGKHGLLISPGQGPSQRLAVVYTSIGNLPESPGNPYSWIGDFCDRCNKCVRSCPAGAIYRDKPIQDDGNPRHVDYRKCIGPFTQSMGCSVCIRDCVFFRGDMGKIESSYLK